MKKETVNSKKKSRSIINFIQGIRVWYLEFMYSLHLKARYLHDRTYENVKIYKKYTDNPITDKLHKATLLAFIISFTVFTTSQVIFPYYFSSKGRDASGVTIKLEEPKTKEITYNQWQKQRMHMKDIVLNPDGTTTAKLYGSVVQYQGEDGEWRDINTNIKKVNGQLQVTEAPYKAYFSVDPAQDLNIIVEGNEVLNSYIGSSNGTPNIEGNKITYIDAYPKTDIERIFNDAEVKQNIVLKSPGHPTEFRENLASKLEIKIIDDNSLGYYSGKKLVATTPPIMLIDADGTKARPTLKYENGVLTITLPETKFLAYPIVIDPSTTITGIGSDDTFITRSDDGYGNITWGNNVTAGALDCNSGYPYYAYCYWRFPFTGITGNITSATLNLRLYNGDNHIWFGETTYLQILHKNPINPGSDTPVTLYNSATKNVIGTMPFPFNGTFTDVYGSLSITADAQEDISSGYSYVSLQGINAYPHYIFSGDHTTVSFRPYLSVTYDTLPIAPGNFSGVGQSSSSVQWSWGNVPGETGYRVHDVANNNLSGDLAADTTTWTENNLSANTGYARHVHSLNAGGESPASSVATKYTFAVGPSVSEVSGKSANNLYNTEALTFQNGNSFGAGGVQYYRYVMDQTATRSWYDGELQWSSGNLTVDTPGEGNYYLHVKSFNADNVGSGTIDVGPFTMDHFSPIASSLSLKDNITGNTFTSGIVKMSGVFNDLLTQNSYVVTGSTGGAAEQLTGNGDAYRRGQTFTANNTFGAVSLLAPSWANNVGSLNLALYTDINRTTKIAEKPFYNYLDNNWLELSFTAQNPGSYYLEWMTANWGEGVGAWRTSSNYTGGSGYNVGVSNGVDYMVRWNEFSGPGNALKVQFSEDGTNWGLWNGTTNYTTGGENWGPNTYLTITSSANLQTLDNSANGIWQFNGDGTKNLYVRVHDGTNIGGKTYTVKGDFSTALTESVSITGIATAGNATIQISGSSGSGVNTYLLWDGASAPSGWSFDDSFNGKLIRGNSVVGVGGGGEHSHTFTSFATGASYNPPYANGFACTGSGFVSPDHSHTFGTFPTINPAAESFPPYRTLRIIKYLGVPNEVPDGAIAFFDSALPLGWSDYSAQANLFIMPSASAGATGGLDYHSHNYTSVNTTSRNGGFTFSMNAAGSSGPYSIPSSGHTHSVGSSNFVQNSSPPSIGIVLGKVSGAREIPINMIGMFSAAPPTGWTISSNSGGPLYQKYVKATFHYGIVEGAETHGGGPVYINTSESSPNNTYYLSSGGCGTFAINHSHVISSPSVTGASYIPPYADFIFAKNTGSGYALAGYLGKNGTGLRYGDPATSQLYKWQNLRWSATGLNANYKIGFQVRAADTWGSGDAGYVNPQDGTSSYYYVTSGNEGTIPILSSLASTKTLETRIIFESSDGLSTPILKSTNVEAAPLTNIIIDTASPAVFDLTSPNDNAAVAPSPTFFWQASSDPGSGLAKYQLFIDEVLNKDNIGSGDTSTQATAPLTHGNHTWYIKAFDSAGNERRSTSTRTVKVDLEGPVITDNQPGDDTWRHENSGVYNVDLTDTGTGLSKFETKVTLAANYGGIVIQDWTKVADVSGETYTTDWALLQSTWDALQEGVNYVYVRTTDVATNAYQSTDYVFYVKKDTVLPTNGVTTSGYYGSTNSPWPGNITGTAADVGGSGVQKTEAKIKGPGNKYWNGSSWVDQVSWVEATGTSTWSYAINQSNFQDGSSYDIEARTTDVAGNLQITLSSGSFTYDSTFPIGSIDINNGATYSSSSIVELRFPNTSADVDKMKVSNHSNLTSDGENTDSGNWINYNSGPISWNLDEGNGIKNIYVIFRDLAGNESLQPYPAQIYMDLFMPSSSITAPVDLAKINDLSTISGTILEEGIGFTAKSQVSVAIIDGSGLYWNGLLFDTPETWNEVTTLTGTLPNYEWVYATLPIFTNGNYTVKVKASDDAGNNEIAGSGNTFTFDNILPTIDSLTSSSHVNQDTWYGVHDVSVAFSGTDTATGNTGILGYSYVFDQISDTNPDEISEGLTATESYTAVADGAWYFHVRTKDGAGNWSNPAHYAIKIDLTGPVEGSPEFAVNGIDDTKIEVTFGKFVDHSGVNKYYVYRATASNSPSSTQTTDPGINPLSLTYTNLVTEITADNAESYLYTDTGLTQGWYYYKIYADDKSNPQNTSPTYYSHSKTNFIPNSISFTANGTTNPITINPTDSRSLSLLWQTTDPDGQGDIVTTKITVKKPDGSVLASYDQADGRMARTNISNGYSITASYDMPTGIGYGNYTIYATTIDSIGLSAHIKDSNVVTIKLITESVPTLIATGIKSTQINLSWQATTISEGLRATNRYSVERKLTSENDSAFAQIGQTNDLTYINTGLTMNVSYTYRVRANDVSDNAGLWSVVAVAVPPKPVAPDAPMLKDVSASTVDLGGTYPIRYVVSWNAVTESQVPDFKGYKLYREVNNVWEGTPVAEINCVTLGQNLTYYLALHTSSDAGKVYRYKVGTWDEANNLGDLAETPATDAMVTPMITAQPTVTDRGVSWIKLSWNSNLSTESVVQYKKSSDGEYTNFAGNPVATNELDGSNYVNTVTIDGLDKGTSYDFKVQSMTTAGFLSAESPKVTGETKPFNINYDPSTGKTLSSSSAEIIWNTGDVSAQGYIEYKKGNTGETKVVGTGKDETTHLVVLTDLSEGDYVFTLKNIDSSGNITTSALQSFTITGFTTGTISAPQAGKIEEQDITATSAKITWTSTVSTTSWIDYGNTSGVYTKSTGNDTLTVDHVVNMDGLVPGETYFYIVRGKDANGIDYKSKEYSFVALAKPGISSVKVSDVTSYSAKIEIVATKEVQASVSYGRDGRFDLKAGNTKLAKEHEVKLENLEDNGNYSYVIDVVDSSGNTARSQSGTFSTPIDTTGPEIKEVKTDILPLGESDEYAQVIISWTTSKPATTKIEYGEGIIGGKYEKNSVPDDSLNTSHTVIIKDINPATTYHFRLVSQDKRGNITRSNDYTFVAPTKEKSILQLIIKSLEETFSWVSNIGQFFRNLGKKAQ